MIYVELQMKPQLNKKISKFMCLTFPCATLYRPESFFTPTAAAIYDYTLDDRHEAFWRSVR